MKKIILLQFLMLTFTISLLPAQSMPELPNILNKMELANQYFFDKFPDPGAKADNKRPGNIWTRATYMEGLLALYNINSDQKYYKYLEDWGEFHNWGMRSGAYTRNADGQCCGQAYIEMYHLDPKPERIKDITTSISNMVNGDYVADWNWIDAIHMAMPVYAKLGVLYKNPAYFDKMHALYSYSRNKHGTNGLYNPEKGLWWRDKDFDPPFKEPNGEDCYWSRGNGWVFAALVRILDVLPEELVYCKEYIQTFKEMAAALKRVQREDGFWNVSLHDPDNYGGPETSGTAFFTYGMAWGIRKGYLDSNDFLPVTISGWKALSETALHKSGFLGYVQSTGKQPSDGQPVNYTRVPNYEDYGLGAFLLAGSEVYKLTKKLAITEQAKPGDVNNDGEVNINDALLIARYSVDFPVKIDLNLGDVDCSRKINIIDALLIARYYVGNIKSLPVCLK